MISFLVSFFHMANGKNTTAIRLRRTLRCKKRILCYVLVPIFVLGIIYYMAVSSKRVPYDQGAFADPNHPLLGCDFFSGKWVYDNESYPLYKEQHCFYQFDACEKAGRMDINYQNWRWQPYKCDLPRSSLYLFRYAMVYAKYYKKIFY